MPVDWSAFGGGAGETSLGSGVAVLMLIAILLIFALPRRFVLAPLMFGLFLLPMGQTFVVAGVHLYVTRILILAGLIRSVISRRSGGTLLSFGYSSVDKVFTFWTIFRASAFILVYREIGAVVNQLGFLWDAFGGYFLMRMLIVGNDDVRRAIKVLCGVAATLATSMLYEKLTGVNLYGIIAGHPIVSEIREGAIRAQGPFHHAILAGTFGATLLPLFFWVWKNRESRVLGLVGMVASTVITLCAASSTPVLAYMAAVLAICLWPMRQRMRFIRRGIVICILMLNFAMHAPVWWLLAHIDIAGGSAGHHRAELVDNFVTHFGDWWLVGTKDNGSWGFLMNDISNQYVAEGETGGLVSFVCIIAVLTLLFKKIGMSRRFVQGNRKKEWYFWLLGAALFSHSVAFLGISYFDQTRFSWYALLAMLMVATSTAFAESRQAALYDTSRHAEGIELRDVVFPGSRHERLGEQIL